MALDSRHDTSHSVSRCHARSLALPLVCQPATAQTSLVDATASILNSGRVWLAPGFRIVGEHILTALKQERSQNLALQDDESMENSRLIQDVITMHLRVDHVRPATWSSDVVRLGMVSKSADVTAAHIRKVKLGFMTLAEVLFVAQRLAWSGLCRRVYNAFKRKEVELVLLWAFSLNDETPVKLRVRDVSTSDADRHKVHDETLKRVDLATADDATAKVLQWEVRLGMLLKDVSTDTYHDISMEIVTPPEALDSTTSENLVRSYNEAILSHGFGGEFEESF